MTRLREVSAQLPAGVVQRLVERAAGRLRGAPRARRWARPSIASATSTRRWCGVSSSSIALRTSCSSSLCSASCVRPETGGRERAPRLVGDGQLASLPGAAAHLHGGLVEGELVRPGREPAQPAEVVEPCEDAEQRVGGGLLRDVVEVVAQRAEAQPGAAPPRSGRRGGGAHGAARRPRHGPRRRRGGCSATRATPGRVVDDPRSEPVAPRGPR